MARVGIDLDGVVYDFAKAFKDSLDFHGHDTSTFCEAVNWHFYRDWGYSDEEFLKHFAEGVDMGLIFGDGFPREGSRSAFERIRAAGHTIHIGTDRRIGQPGLAEKHTVAWLARYGLKYDTITFTADKTVLNVDYFVEDKLENYDALTKAGVDTYLINRPWNAQADGTYNDLRRRIESITEFADIVTGRHARVGAHR